MLLRNSAANALRAASTSASSLAVPLTLVWVLTPASYGAWAIAFGAASLLLFLDLGFPTSAQVLVSRHLNKGDRASAVGTAWSTALLTLSLVAVIAVPASAFQLLIPTIYPDVPESLVAATRLCFVILAVGQASSLLSNALTSYFAGALRSLTATAILGPARLSAAACCVALAFAGGTIESLALAYTTPLILGTAVLGAALLRESRKARASRPQGLFRGALLVLRFNRTLAIWSIATAIVSGFDLLLVGAFDFAAVPAFSIATAACAGVVGLNSAVLSAILPVLARIPSSDFQHRNALLIRLSALNTTLLGLVMCAVLMTMEAVPQLRDTSPYFAVLGLGLIIRGIVAPLSFALIATGAHRRVLWPPIMEAGANLSLSLLLGKVFGAMGVASGTLVASIFGALILIRGARRWASSLEGAGNLSSGVQICLPLVVCLPFFALVAIEPQHLGALAMGACSTLAMIALSARAAMSSRQLTSRVRPGC